MEIQTKFKLGDVVTNHLDEKGPVTIIETVTLRTDRGAQETWVTYTYNGLKGSGTEFYGQEEDLTLVEAAPSAYTDVEPK